MPKIVEVWNEDCTEAISLTCVSTTKAVEVRDALAEMLQVDEGKIVLRQKIGGQMRPFLVNDEASRKMYAFGVRSFKRQQRRYEHPIVIIGAGLGALFTMMDLKRRGQNNFLCIETHDDFGGSSWITVANKYTKLQTERGTYYFDYPKAGAPITSHLDDGEVYPTWPSRDKILAHLREQARANGLEEHARFCTTVEKVKVLDKAPVAGVGINARMTSADASVPGPDRKYSVMTVPVTNFGEDVVGDGELVIAGAVISWPGNLTHPNIVDLTGEDLFDGYIEYSSFDKVDYTMAEGKPVILYGHGAFTIENVRTLLEHKASKIFVLCRKRNLTGMKVGSWLCSQTGVPIPGHILLKVFQQIYDLYNWDCWTAHSVTTDAKRSFAHIQGKTVFGVNDLYFLAGYYGLCEIIEEEIKRLSHHTAHLAKSGRKIKAEMIVKAVGTRPGFKFEKVIGMKEHVGLWCNGDPLRPISCNGAGLNARNFTTFSSGPGFAQQARMMSWFIDFPQDCKDVFPMLPKRKSDDLPAYVVGQAHGMSTGVALNTALPVLAKEMAEIDALKPTHVRKAHPLEEFIGQAKAEWDMYTRMLKMNGQISQDTPECPYPYTVEYVRDIMREVDEYWMKKMGTKSGTGNAN